MFVRNGVALGSVQADPNAPRYHTDDDAKVEAPEPTAEVVESPAADAGSDDAPAAPEPEATPEPPKEEPKKAPPKKAAPAGLKSALDTTKG